MLKPILDSLDGLPEAIKAEYQAGDDGKYVLQVEQQGGWALENVASLRSALERLKAQVSAGKGWKDLGKTPDEVRDALARLEALESTEGETEKTKKLRDTLEKQLREKWEREVTSREDTIKRLRSKIQDEMQGTQALLAIAAKKGNPKLLLPIVKSMTRIEDRNGEFVAEVFDPSDPERTARITRKPGLTNPMSIEELVDELSKTEEYAGAFAGSGSSGSGAMPRDGTGAKLTGAAYYESEEFKRLPASDRMRIFREREGAAAGANGR